MEDCSIIMQAESVRGIMAGTKTQTRRIIKPQPPEGWNRHCWFDEPMYGFTREPPPATEWHKVRCRYITGKKMIGNRLWVRETWQPLRTQTKAERAKVATILERFQSGKVKDIVGEALKMSAVGSTGALAYLYAADFGDWAYDVDSDLKPWRPSIYMPREASRLTLEVKTIRVERVREISENDAIAEGFPRKEMPNSAPIGQYRQAWNRINGKDAWDKNPWVWVIAFRRIV